MSEKKIGWYSNINELYLDYRKMSTRQLETKYKEVSISTIKNTLKTNGFATNKDNINKTLEHEEIIYMYDSLLSGEIITFSSGMFTEANENRYAYCDIILKYIFINILQWDREDFCKFYSSKVLKKYKISGMLLGLNILTYDVLQIVCPEYNIKPWELKSSACGNDFWNDENIRVALEWAKVSIENELKWMVLNTNWKNL